MRRDPSYATVRHHSVSWALRRLILPRNTLAPRMAESVQQRSGVRPSVCPSVPWPKKIGALATRETVLDRGSRSDRPRYHTRMRRSPPLRLASAARCCTPCHARWQLMTSQLKPTTTAINQYSQDAAVDTRSALAVTFDFDLWPWLLLPASSSHDSHTCKKIEVKVSWFKR